MISGKGLAFAAIDFLVCVTLWMLMQLAPPPTPKSAIKTYGLYAVTMQWPARCWADIDLYVREPDGTVVYFAHVNGHVSHLTHDDVPRNGGGYKGEPNYERNEIRAVEPGEFTVNGHVYDDAGCRPIGPVRFQLWKLAGSDTLVMSRTIMFRGFGDEQTAFRFSLRRDGSVFGENHLPRSLLG